ncbi:UNVERIFIED_CONTAM: hypothetical protein PYX00_003081 [Menopon gallinae]|uniref:Uncharacterized protein n=1 Tax=Menopon gallinae TaxID=328185 RepID=A0AAW2I009_9NEOP
MARYPRTTRSQRKSRDERQSEKRLGRRVTATAEAYTETMAGNPKISPGAIAIKTEDKTHVEVPRETGAITLNVGQSRVRKVQNGELLLQEPIPDHQPKTIKKQQKSAGTTTHSVIDNNAAEEPTGWYQQPAAASPQRFFTPTYLLNWRRPPSSFPDSESSSSTRTLYDRNGHHLRFWNLRAPSREEDKLQTSSKQYLTVHGIVIPPKLEGV